MLKKILRISVWVLTVAAIACLWFFIRKQHIENPLKRVDLTLERTTENGFIDSLALYQNIMSICDTANNTVIGDIPLDSVRSYLKSIPWAVYTEANMTLDEVLVVKVVECQPIMRVYNAKGESVLLDAEGRIFPVKENYPLHLLIASGEIKFEALHDKSASVYDPDYASSDLPKVYNVMRSIQKNSYSNCCVKQVYYDGSNFELVMNNVDVEVILGDGDSNDVKLKNLEIFFKRMQGSPDLKNYSKINFNFENQVVCTKNKTKK